MRKIIQVVALCLAIFAISGVCFAQQFTPPSAMRYRFVDGQLYDTSRSILWHQISGKLLTPGSGGVFMQTFTTNNIYESYYVRPPELQSNGAYSAPGAYGWKKHLVSSTVTPDKELFIRHYHFWNAQFEVTINAMQIFTTNIFGADEVWDIGTPPVATATNSPSK